MGLKVYTDGGCWGNPGPGGWAFVIEAGGASFQGNGAEKGTTNNRMELTAVIKALEFILAACDRGDQGFVLADGEKIELHTDSQYVQKGISEWIHSWMRNGWKTAAKEPVKNKEIWQALWEVQTKLPITWKWVKGHAGHPQNEACDALVQQAIGTIQAR